MPIDPLDYKFSADCLALTMIVNNDTLFARILFILGFSEFPFLSQRGQLGLESWPRRRESLLYFSLPRLAVLFPRRRLYCNGTYYEGQQWIVEASLRPLEAAQSLCCDGADGAGGAGVPGPKDEATGLQSEGRSLTLLGHIFLKG